MGSKQKVIKGVAWTIIVNLVNAIYGFISVPILIGYFGKAEYGLIGLAMSINVYLQLMDMGFSSTNVRFFSNWLAQNNESKVKKAFSTSISFYLCIGLVNAVILFFIALFSHEIFNVDENQNIILKKLIYILCFSAFCSWLLSCFEQLVKATENVDWIQRIILMTKVLMIVALFVTIYGRISIYSYFMLTCLATLSSIPFMLFKIKKELQYISFVPKFDKILFKEMLPYCMNIFSFSLFQFSFYHLRPVFLGMQGTVESVADYRILNAIIGVVSMFGGTFLNVLLPTSAKVVAQENKEAYYRIAYNGTKYVTIIISFCCFGIMTIAPELLMLYVGDQYLYLIPWLNIWLLCTLGTHNQAISSLILSGSDIRAITYNSVVASCLGLLTCWFLIPYFQIGGTIISFLIYLIIQLGFYYGYYWKYKMNIDSWKVFSKSFFPYVFCGCIIFILSKFIPKMDSIYISVFVKGIIFMLSYCILTWILINDEDKNFINGIFKRQHER